MKKILRSFQKLFDGTARTRASFVLIALSLLLIAAVSFSLYVGFSHGGSAASDHTKESYWAERIHSIGAKAAYAEFDTYTKTQDASLQHKLSHVFGAALYTEVGIAGLPVCNFNFQSGCLHEFFRHVTEEYGTAPLVAMEKECEEINGLPGLCEHAIGHGLIAYFGYDKEALKQALDFCGKSFTYDPVFGCTGGVFMEYNGYTLLDSTSQPRALGPGGWYEPCTGIADRYLRSCVWWLPRWWSESFPPGTATTETVFKKIGELCHELPMQTYRRECFESTGQKIASTVHFDIEKIKAICNTATRGSSERLFCLSYAASMFITSDVENPPVAGAMLGSTTIKTKEKAFAVCADLPTNSKTFCEAYADNTRYVYNELALPNPL